MLADNSMNSVRRLYKSLYLMSLIPVICSGLKSMITKSNRRGYTTMSVTNGVIIGGGRIGSYLHESNGDHPCRLI